MQTMLRVSAAALAAVGVVTLACAQNAPGSRPHQDLNLSQSQERMVSQGLSGEQTQTAPGYQGQVGSKPPNSLKEQALPGPVTDQVPETKNYFFIKMPDRVLLIDPDTKLVAEMILAPATTGSAPERAPAETPNSPPR